tara:strand:+ start:62056 stop:63036 length:981 start_codon:yes stop_codon:yes gene_type:complete
MAYLDNSGDIILDAVLTDAGRKRLAEGDGSFRITKYAFGDDEIDYSNYNASHSSGSAYYDLEILQSPILEAFTNNTANMKSKLVTLTNNNILYLPVMILNQQVEEVQMNQSVGSGSFIVSVDQTTTTTFKDNFDTLGNYIPGDNPSSAEPKVTNIRVDQGLNTTEISNAYKIDAELQENQYIVELDNRFGSVATADFNALANTQDAGAPTSFSFIDDDNIASYYLSTSDFVKSTDSAPLNDNETTNTDETIRKAIAGPRGTHVAFKIRASTNLRTSTYLFERLGNTFSASTTGGTKTFYYIDTIVRVTGATTGYKIDVPVRFVKQQ